MEKFKSPENLEKRLISLLKEKGLEDSETKNLLNSWILDQEKQTEKSNDYKTTQIEVNLKRARLYFEAGYVNEAFENFEDARTQAWNENKEELYKAIMVEMDKFGM